MSEYYLGRRILGGAKEKTGAKLMEVWRLRTVARRRPTAVDLSARRARSDRGATRARDRSRMFEPLTHDGMMRLARRERASPRRETPIRAESGRSPGAVEPEIARVDDDVEHDDALRGRARRDHVPFTLGRALQMSGSAPNVAYKCCSKCVCGSGSQARLDRAAARQTAHAREES